MARGRMIDWRWSGSSLVDNTARGMLAEFLVAAALGVHIHPTVRGSNGNPTICKLVA